MGMETALTLVLNPGTASRKYALYRGNAVQARLHFEHENGAIVVTVWTAAAGHAQPAASPITDLHDASGQVEPLLRQHGVLADGDTISLLATRVVAPTSFFLGDHVVDDHVVWQLEQAAVRAPLHVAIVLDEVRRIRAIFPGVKLVTVSDSAFHGTKPDYAWNYAIDLAVADQYDIKRFGYHGLSVAAATQALRHSPIYARRVVVCHMGSGNSVSAVLDGTSIDNTMGYSPLEGVTMATRSGSIDPVAVAELQRVKGFDTQAAIGYLNSQSGLLGISGSSSDIRVLRQKEAEGDYRATLALKLYVYNLQKAIGQMIAVLGGIDALAFTGTVGERSNISRQRILKNFAYAGLVLDERVNDKTIGPAHMTAIHDWRTSKPILVIPADEEAQIVRAALAV